MFKDLFSLISVKELNERIEYFRDYVDIRSSSEDQIKKELNKIFTIEYNEEPLTFFLNTDVEISEFNANFFYRIREFTTEDKDNIESMNFPSMQKKQDAWYKPDDYVYKYGRLNRIGKSVLYVSINCVNAIYEKECEIGDYFFMSVYSTKRKKRRMSQIQHIQYIKELSEEENAKRIIMHNFLYSEFTKHVSSGREFLYKTSLLIYEEYFYNHDIDGFVYPSIASNCKTGYNVCFSKEKADENLDLVCVMVCRLLPSNGNSEFVIEHKYDGLLNDDNTFSFYKPNSQFVKSKIGHFDFVRQTGCL